MSEEDQNQASQHQQDEGVKSEDANATINIKVVSSTGEEVFFKIKRSTKLSKLQGAYASKVGKDVGSIRFLYDGDRINDDDTPASLDMEDNDTIDVMVEQVGGSHSLP
ncbi:ubiquitin-related domain-containing protein [Crucibulum laeve]|uniref:Ubiquitin-related domain-containing protein n=1 Tax=Crucibulum laeve TaxID=68775 RepID=A0A5C3LYQ5_9AGAR|nr:ubiquitin-related domain-containing protein [Crucibulum laeve]